MVRQLPAGRTHPARPAFHVPEAVAPHRAGTADRIIVRLDLDTDDVVLGRRGRGGIDLDITDYEPTRFGRHGAREARAINGFAGRRPDRVQQANAVAARGKVDPARYCDGARVVEPQGHSAAARATDRGRRLRPSEPARRPAAEGAVGERQRSGLGRYEPPAGLTRCARDDRRLRGGLRRCPGIGGVERARDAGSRAVTRGRRFVHEGSASSQRPLAIRRHVSSPRDPRRARHVVVAPTDSEHTTRRGRLCSGRASRG